MIQQPRDYVMTEVFLSPPQFARLLEWITRSVAHTKHKATGGFRQRRVDWASRLNATRCSILLTTHSSSMRRTMDDVSWIQRTIMNQHAGGFETRIARIFENTHPSFTDLPVKPRQPKRKSGSGAAAAPTV